MAPPWRRHAPLPARAPVSFETAQQSHRAFQGGGLRAATFGLSDGVVTVLCITLGVFSEHTVGASSPHSRLAAVAISGLSGLLGGAGSMAVGEWVSMTTHGEALAAQLAVEAGHLRDYPDQEAAALAQLLISRGVPCEAASALASQLSGHEAALEVHARLEHGIDPNELGQPLTAAAASFVCFALGGLPPLLPWLLAAYARVPLTAPQAAGISIALSASLLAAAGASLSVTVAAMPSTQPEGGQRPRVARTVVWGAARQVGAAAVAAGITFGIGAAVGARAQ